MSNVLKGDVEVVLDKRRTLRFTSNSMVRLEGALGFSYKLLLKRFQTAAQIAARHGLAFDGKDDDAAIMETNLEAVDAGVELSAGELRAMLWAGLLHEDPELGIERAGDLMDLAPGGSGMAREQYIAIHVMTAFLLRFAPEIHTQKIRKQAKTVEDLLNKRLSGETISDSVDSLSGAGLPKNGSGE